MAQTGESGQSIILNGVPRSGKSSIVAGVQETCDGPWMNLGVDTFKERVTPKRYSPGIGLRPIGPRAGGERLDIDPLVPIFYAATYESIAAHSRLGLNAVVDVGHHDPYATPQKILEDSARRLNGLPVLLVASSLPH